MNQSRIDRVAANMAREGLSQILVTAPASVFYLTGTWVSPGERMLALLVKGDGSAVLYANRLFALSESVDFPLVEFDDTERMFSTPKDKRTEDYITGRFG